MKINDEIQNQDVYRLLENMKNIHISNDRIYTILDVIEGCMSDARLKYLPADIIVNSRSGAVVLMYEEVENDYLMVTFNVIGDDDISIDYSYFTNNKIMSVEKKNWENVLKLINTWKN